MWFYPVYIQWCMVRVPCLLWLCSHIYIYELCIYTFIYIYIIPYILYILDTDLVFTVVVGIL